MRDDELPPRQREAGDPPAPDVDGPGGVTVDRGGADDDRGAPPPADRVPDGQARERLVETGSGGTGDVPDDADDVRADDVRADDEVRADDRAAEVRPDVWADEVSGSGQVPVDVPGEHEADHVAVSDDDTEAAIAPQQQRLPGEPESLPYEPESLPDEPESLAPRAVARGRLGHAMRPRATRGQLLAAALCALLGFALVVQARQTQTQGLDSLRQADLVRLLDNVTNAEARAEQDVRDEQAIRDRLLSGTGSSAAAQEAAQKRLDTLGLLAGTVPASGPGIELEIIDPRRQVDAPTLLDTLEELRDGGAEVIQIGPVRVVASTSFTDEADGVRVDTRVLTPPYTFKVIGEPQTLARLLQIPGGVLDVLHGKGADGKVTQPATVTIDALRSPAQPQYARPAPGATP